MTKKLAILAGLLVLSATTAFAYSIDDPINQVFDWSSHPDNFDRVGRRIYEIFGMNITPGLTETKFEIFTNYPQEGDSAVSGWSTFPADLAFNFDGDTTYEYGVAFTDNAGLTPGQLYGDTSWFQSNDYDPTSVNRSWPYAGAGYAYHEFQIVTIADYDDELALGDLSWNTFDTNPSADSGNLIPNWRIELVFDNDLLPSENFFLRPFDVFYGGANCANDFIGGRYTPPPTIPEPTSMGLLALGCLGLATLRKRRSA